VSRTKVTKEDVDKLAAALNQGQVVRGPREYRIPLTFPLPHMDSVEGANGKWYHIPWTTRTRARAMANHYRLATKEEYERWQRFGT
jgi:hypothetical protein